MTLDARILVVEDDPSQREMLAGFMRDLGADVEEAEDGKKGELRGLDDNPVETLTVMADRLRLGEWLRSDVPFLSADLSIFESIGLRQGGGIIGNDFLDDYSLVEIDFESSIISLWK